MYPEQQRYWVSLLNLQRTWADDAAALGFLPPRYRDFTSPAPWPQRRALTFLLNNLELIRESYRRLEAGEMPDYDLLNNGLANLRLTLRPWKTLAEIRSRGRAKRDLGGRLESLQVRAQALEDDFNPGTRYIRATVERSLYYFAQYVDSRLSDPAYPQVSPGRWFVTGDPQSRGDLVLRRKEEG